MEIGFDVEALRRAVQAVSAAVAEAGPRPVLQCVHMETKREQVIVSAMDLAKGIVLRRTVQATITDGGTGLVVGTRLAGILREVAPGEVTIKIAEGHAEVRTGRSTFRLPTQDPAEFPVLPHAKKPAVTLASEVLDALVRRTVFAAAKEEARYAIQGVSLGVAGDKIEFAATDGRRLAVASAPAEGKMERVIASPAVLAEVRKLASEAEEIGLSVEGGRLLASAGGALAGGGLIEGTFPAYGEMIPKPAGRKFSVRGADFASALRQAAQITTPDSKAAVFKVSPGKIVVEAKSPEMGEASIEVDAAYEGEAFSAAFNVQYVLDVVDEFADGDIPIEIEAADKPAVFRREGLVYVVAPVRLRGE